jgi:hypothetical protein
VQSMQLMLKLAVPRMVLDWSNLWVATVVCEPLVPFCSIPLLWVPAEASLDFSENPLGSSSSETEWFFVIQN